MKCESSLVLVLLFTLLLPVGAQAQSPGASPTYGDVGLSAGFDQDPSTKHLFAGGGLRRAWEAVLTVLTSSVPLFSFLRWICGPHSVADDTFCF